MNARFPEDPELGRVLHAFGITPEALLGRGAQASVYALGTERVVRVHRPGPSAVSLACRARLLEEITSQAQGLPFQLPSVLDTQLVQERWVSIEPRLPGRPLHEMLDSAGGELRRSLVLSYLDAARQLAQVRWRFYGDLLGDDAIVAPSFREYAERRARRSLAAAGGRLSAIDSAELARALPDAREASLVYLDFYPSNVLVEAGRVSAVVDFGGAVISGDSRFGAVVPATYLAERDQAIAQRWLAEQGLSEWYVPTRRWVAAYWSFAADDTALFQWCQRVLLGARPD